MSIFKEASRKNLRFKTTHHSNLSVSDLWSLPLQSQVKSSLDNAYSLLQKELRVDNEDSFFQTKNSEQSDNELRLEVLKEIMSDRVEENKAKVDKKAKETQKEKLQEILQSKKDEDLQGKSVEEIEAMLQELS